MVYDDSIRDTSIYVLNVIHIRKDYKNEKNKEKKQADLSKDTFWIGSVCQCICRFLDRKDTDRIQLCQPE